MDVAGTVRRARERLTNVLADGRTAGHSTTVRHAACSPVRAAMPVQSGVVPVAVQKAAYSCRLLRVRWNAAQSMSLGTPCQTVTLPTRTWVRNELP